MTLGKKVKLHGIGRNASSRVQMTWRIDLIKKFLFSRVIDTELLNDSIDEVDPKVRTDLMAV